MARAIAALQARPAGMVNELEGREIAMPVPLETLFDGAPGEPLPLPPELEQLYGRLALPPASDERPYIFGNFVETLDGVAVAHAGQESLDISGGNEQDQMVMGLLRACADAVVVGAGTLRDARSHRWTPDFIYPELAPAYRLLRERLARAGQPLNVIVSAHGNIDVSLPVFHDPAIEVVLITTDLGRERLRRARLPASVHLEIAGAGAALEARAILEALGRVRRCERVLIEGGPHLMGVFLAGQLIDELFLTLAPQVAGRAAQEERPGFVAGRLFLPGDPRWGELVSVKRAASYLFLRYAFSGTGQPARALS
jgi:riboflavin biosynthesis pyrimidine reductase